MRESPRSVFSWSQSVTVEAEIKSGPEQQFKLFLQQGRFMLQRSRSTGRFVFYPRVMVPGSGDADLEWVEACGLGTLYAITVNRTRTGNHNVALVDLDEGPRMMSRIADCETAPIGCRLKAEISTLMGEPAVVFNRLPVGGAA
jgi:uncharacterized OB-fold protein